MFVLLYNIKNLKTAILVACYICFVALVSFANLNQNIEHSQDEISLCVSQDSDFIDDEQFIETTNNSDQAYCSLTSVRTSYTNIIKGETLPIWNPPKA